VVTHLSTKRGRRALALVNVPLSYGPGRHRTTYKLIAATSDGVRRDDRAILLQEMATLARIFIAV